MSDEYLFEKEFRLFGMKRAGNSAFTSFLMGHFKKGEVVHLHNTDLTLYPAYGFKKGLVNRFEDRIKWNGDKVKYLINTVEHMSTFDIAVCSKGHYSYDRECIKYAVNYGKEKFARETYSIVLLRSPHNHLASILKKKWRAFYEGTSRYKEFSELWLEYAREILNITNYVPSKVPVLFDSLVASEEYRRGISYILGIEFNDSGIHRLGGNIGSSFDGKKYRKSAQDMKVDERWKFLFEKHEEKWWQLAECRTKLLNPEVLLYTRYLFDVDLMEDFDGPCAVGNEK